LQPEEAQTHPPPAPLFNLPWFFNSLSPIAVLFPRTRLPEFFVFFSLELQKGGLTKFPLRFPPFPLLNGILIGWRVFFQFLSPPSGKPFQGFPFLHDVPTSYLSVFSCPFSRFSYGQNNSLIMCVFSFSRPSLKTVHPPCTSSDKIILLSGHCLALDPHHQRRLSPRCLMPISFELFPWDQDGEAFPDAWRVSVVLASALTMRIILLSFCEIPPFSQVSLLVQDPPHPRNCNLCPVFSSRFSPAGFPKPDSRQLRT